MYLLMEKEKNAAQQSLSKKEQEVWFQSACIYAREECPTAPGLDLREDIVVIVWPDYWKTFAF